jgi:uncharacterized membrane protein
MGRDQRRRSPEPGLRWPHTPMGTPPDGSPNGRAAASPLLARNVEAVAQLEAADRARQTTAERFSDSIARMAGTGWFAGLHVLWFTMWIAWNSGFLPGVRPIDPFPFSFLTLVVSLEAIFLTLFVLISQNNLTRLSERRAHLDLQVNLLAEQESTKTVALLERIAQKLDIPLPSDSGELSAPTDIREVVNTLDRVLPSDACAADPQTQEGSTDDDPVRDVRTDRARSEPDRPTGAIRGA